MRAKRMDQMSEVKRMAKEFELKGRKGDVSSFIILIGYPAKRAIKKMLAAQAPIDIEDGKDVFDLHDPEAGDVRSGVADRSECDAGSDPGWLQRTYSR